MQYSDFTLEQLMVDPKYQDLCNRFLSLSPNEETTKKLESILYEGGYLNYSPSGDIGRNNPGIDAERRVGLAYLLLNNPDTFDQLVENNIIYFHGTNANALPGILKYGINSVDKSNEQGIEVTTGEEWSRIKGQRAFVSLTDVLDVAEGYSSFNPTKKTELSFPIVLGTTKEDVKSSHYTPISSAVPEVGIMHNFSRDKIRCVLVPSDKVDIVKKMSGDSILVLAADNTTKKFYYFNDLGGIEIFEEEYEEWKSRLNNTPTENISDVNESIFSRSISDVKKAIDKIRGLVKGDEMSHGRRIA